MGLYSPQSNTELKGVIKFSIRMKNKNSVELRVLRGAKKKQKLCKQEESETTTH